MTFFHLLLRNLLYHRRGNLAAFLGLVLATAVLTGALVVGDSLRGSLRRHALSQLAWVDQAMVTPRFFRAALASEVAPISCPLLLLQGSAQNGTYHAGQTTVLGVDDAFWRTGSVPLDPGFWRSSEPAAVINSTLAQHLHINVGDELTFNVQKTDRIPRETLLGQREDVIQAVTAT